jgi:hypothetical protein
MIRKGHPFPVDRKTYDRSIEFLQTCPDKARIEDRDKIETFRRLCFLGKSGQEGISLGRSLQQ